MFQVSNGYSNFKEKVTALPYRTSSKVYCLRFLTSTSHVAVSKQDVTAFTLTAVVVAPKS